MTEFSAAPSSTTVNIVEHTNEAASQAPVVVIGSGPVGVRFCHDYLKRNPKAALVLLGDEPFQPYNRVQLSMLLAGEVSMDEIINPLPSVHQYPNFRHVIARVETLNITAKSVTDTTGEEYPYHRLVFATGSSAHVPNIPNVDMRGVYTFRNLKDTEFLYSRVARSRHIVVVGGGLLGIEAARALRRANTRVTLVQQATRLMNRQLDDRAASLLENKVKDTGIEVITESGVRGILGEERVTGVRLRDGTEIECDTVLLCAGIKPNVSLARAAKLKVANGILVDDQLRTSVTDIYAIGECCEHRGQTYGLVNPGLEQASVAADTVLDRDAHYIGSLAISRLKVLGETVCSMGDVTDPIFRARRYQLRWRKGKNNYRKVVITKGRITGALCYGDWNEIPRVQEAFQGQRKIRPWQVLRFLLTGYLWSQDNDVALWPSTAVICQCNGVTQGELVNAIGEGCCTVAALREKTRASSTCGSCKPLLQTLLGDKSTPEKEKAWLPTLVLGLAAIMLVIALAYFPGQSTSDSVQHISTYESIWNDKLNKQITGFTLLGLSVVGLLMSLRKRIKISFIQSLGNYAWWRFAHVMLGVMCASLLFLHTGMHLGENLNFLLMLNFMAVLVVGAVTAGVISLGHYLSPPNARKMRSVWNWAHTLITWPLPALLGIHILSVYYF